ncbi:MAG: hypothetical protein R3Y36_02675 [Spirochaetales bacterium]
MKKNMFIYLLSFLSIFIPAPPRFAYGLILIFLFNIILLLIKLVNETTEKFDITKYKVVLLLFVVISVSILYHQLLTLFSPLMSLTIGFVIYLIPVALLPINYITPFKEYFCSKTYSELIKLLGIFSGYSLLFFFLRELLAFGSISYPGRNGIVIYHFPIEFLSDYNFFWSSIPGALILAAAFLVTVPAIHFKNKDISEN